VGLIGRNMNVFLLPPVTIHNITDETGHRPMAAKNGPEQFA
jgi:hypothetical protein